MPSAYQEVFALEAHVGRRQGRPNADNKKGSVIFFLYLVVPSEVCQPLDWIVICRAKSGQTAIQLRQRVWVDRVRHHLDLGHQSAGSMSPLDVISF